MATISALIGLIFLKGPTNIGVKNLNKVNYDVMFDRIEAGTYLIAAALTEGHLKISKVKPKIISTEINILKKIGAKIKLKSNSIFIILINI